MSNDKQPLLHRQEAATDSLVLSNVTDKQRTADAPQLPVVPFPAGSLPGETSQREGPDSFTVSDNRSENSLQRDKNSSSVERPSSTGGCLPFGRFGHNDSTAEPETEEDSARQNGVVSSSDKEEEKIALMGEADGGRESVLEKFTSCRWTLAYMVGLMTTVTHCIRNCMSMALVCMSEVDTRRSNDSNLTGILANETFITHIPRDMEGLVLSGYFYGYLFTPFLFGAIAQRFGVKRVVAVAMTLSAALTCVTPVAIYHGVALTVTVRVLLGIVAGSSVPCGTVVWVAWAPQHEKAKLITLSFVGSSAGTIASTLLSGFLCSIPVADGWPFIFYTYGGFSAVWVLVWLCVAYDSPEEHPRIRKKELKMIQQHRTSVDTSPRTEKPKTPWKSIFTSGPFLALIATQISFIWVLNFLNTYLPLYANRQLHFNAQWSGVLSSLPSLCAVLISSIAAVVSDCIQARALLSVTNNRKLFQTIGLVVPGCALCVVGFVPAQHRASAVALMMVAAGFHRVCMCGSRINPLDLSPRLAATLSGIAQTVSNLIQIISVFVTSSLIVDGLRSDWITVFITTGTISFAGAAVFLVFGSGEQQHWA